MENEFIYINVPLDLTNTLWFIKIYFHCILIIIVCHVYIVILYVLYDDVCTYKSSQINVMFCSVMLCTICKQTMNTIQNRTAKTWLNDFNYK